MRVGFFFLGGGESQKFHNRFTLIQMIRRTLTNSKKLGNQVIRPGL